jgi:arylsulfatase A-like enzyme
MRGPGGFAGGRVVDRIVSQVDLLPTILELAGLAAPPYAQGKSLLPLVQKHANKVRDQLFAEITYHAAYDPCRCIRTERHKLIQFFEDRPHFVLANIDDSPTKEVLHEAGLPRGNRPRTLLFDLVADPQEFENLADDPAHAAIRAGLDGRLRTWMQATDDPLLRGPVPLPSGGILTPHTAYSPTERG